MERAMKAAQILGRARLAGTKISALPQACAPRNLEESYRTQHELGGYLAKRGHGAVVGYKIGCTSQVMQDYLGVEHPAAGRLYAAKVYPSGAILEFAGFVQVGIELEIAVRLARDLPAREAAYTRTEVTVAVDAVMGSVELVDDRYDDWRRLGTPTLVADDFFSAGCVLGAPVALTPALDLSRERCVLEVDGEVHASGHGANIMGHPLAALQWLANAQPGPGTLRAGQVITLGSVIEVLWLQGPAQLRARYDHLGIIDLGLV